MAISRQAATTWLHLPTVYNINDVEAVVRADGSVLVALGGADSALNGMVITGVLDLAARSVTGLVTTTYPQAPGNYPFTSVGTIEMRASPMGEVGMMLHLPEYGPTGDLNGTLLFQRFDGTGPLGAAVAVNPDTPADNTAFNTALVYRPSGASVAFITEQTAAGGPSNGIRMARFAADGTAQGAPITVIADHAVAGSVSMEANPIMVDAVRMADGNYALTWTESAAFTAPTFGQPRVMFQMVGANARAIGTAIEIDGTAAQKSQIIALKDGGLVVAWLDFAVGVQGVYRAQMLSATGQKVGAVFDLSSSISTQETDLTLVALNNGGWAAAWRDMAHQTHLARMFDATGTATGGDFQVIDTAGNFIGGAAGLLAQGNMLVTWMHGLNGSVGGGIVLQSQSFATTSSLGVTRQGGAGQDTLSGKALDDVLSGAAGNDVLSGSFGSDTLSGGDGRDRLSAGDGVDQLTGGLGADTLSGGAGSDTFVFAAAAEGGDRITDFNGAEGDLLVLHRAGFGGAAGVLSGASTNTAHIGLFFNTTTGVLSFDADGAGTTARVTVATLTGVSMLAYDDVLLL